MPWNVTDLLSGALDRFQTLALEIEQWTDPELLMRAWSRSGTEGAPYNIFRPVDGPPVDAPGMALDGTWRIWWKKPDLWRDEFVRDATPSGVDVVRGGIATSYVPSFREIYTNDPQLRTGIPLAESQLPSLSLSTITDRQGQITLLGPPFAQAGWRLDVHGEARFLGRTVIEIETRNTGSAPPHPYWEGVKHFTALLDAERGLPLRLTALVDGEVAATHMARSIAFDEPIEDGVFRLEPPPGTTVVRVG